MGHRCNTQDTCEYCNFKKILYELCVEIKASKNIKELVYNIRSFLILLKSYNGIGEIDLNVFDDPFNLLFDKYCICNCYLLFEHYFNF